MAFFSPFRPNFLSILACLIAGGLSVLSFAPLSWSWVIFVCLSILFFLSRAVPAKKAFFFGFAFGLGQFCVGVSWVYVSLHTYGGMPLWMGGIAVLGFASILGLFAGLTTYSAARLVPHAGVLRLLAMACFWVMYEWLRSWVLTGFPWLELGYSQTATWLFAFAPVGGVYLVSFAVTLISCCLVWLIIYKQKAISASIIAMTLVFAFLSNSVLWTKDAGQALNVGLVQPNTDIEKKWQSQYRNQFIDDLRRLSNDLQSQQAEPLDLLIWPETALPLYYQQTDFTFWQTLHDSNTALLTGLLDSPNAGGEEVYNAAVLSCGSEQQLYRKRHLVPFGEYLPLRFLFNWVLEYLQLPMSDLSSWSAEQSLRCGEKINIGLSICYEDAFANELRQSVGDATILVNISEDAWFGDSLAPHQRLQMAQMRARELSRPLVRSANTGPSVVIDQHGKVLARTEQFKAQTLAYRVQPQVGDTPYKRFGNWVVYVCFMLLVIGGIVSYRHRKH